MLELLVRARCYHGVVPQFMKGRTGAAQPFRRTDDGGDLVETSFLIMGLLCARAYFNRGAPQETALPDRIHASWHDVEWDWYTPTAVKCCIGIGVPTTTGRSIWKFAVGMRHW